MFNSFVWFVSNNAASGNHSSLLTVSEHLSPKSMNKEYLTDKIEENNLLFRKADNSFERGFYEGKVSAYIEILASLLDN